MMNGNKEAVLKTLFRIARFVVVVLTLNAITLDWGPTAQYILALVSPLVWGITSYIEGIKGL